MQYTKTTQALLATAALALAIGTTPASAEDAYIQSNTQTDGAVYSINTGYRIKPTTGIYADFEFLAKTTAYQQFVWESTGGGTARFYINGSGQPAWNFTTEAVWSTTSQTMVPGTRYQMSVDASTRTAWLDVAGVRKYTGGFGSATVPNYTDTIKLFSNNSANGNAAMMKLYRFTITESGETVHDYIPALKGGMVGLYDSTTGDFLYDVRATPKAFTYGGDILELEDDPYVENTGSGAINTRFLMAPDTKVEVDYALAGGNATQRRLFGADADGANFFSSYYINGSGNMSFGIGDAFKPWSTGIVTNNFRHRAVLDVEGIHAYYITRFVTNWTGNASAAYGMWPTNITKTAAHPLAIFGDTTAASGLTFNNACKARIYSVKCYKAGALVHDYTPCVKGGVPGFKDLVDGAFITAENPAALRAGGKGLAVEDDDGYISSYGNNVKGFRWIDTGYTASANTRVELDYALADNYPTGNYSGNHDWFLFEAAGSMRFSAFANKNGMGWCGGGNNWTSFSVSKQTTQKDVRRTVVVDAAGWAAIVTAGFTNRTSSVTPASATYNTKTLRLAVSKDGGGYAPIKIYGLKIYESGALVRNYVPYAKDGMAGLRDTETGGFVTASGRVALAAGGDIASNDRNDAYLESDATQGINTGYFMKGSQSRIEADFAFTDCTTNSTGTTGYQQRVFGQDISNDGSELKYALYINGSGNFMFGFGNTFINTHGPGTTADTKRHTAIIDGYHDRLYFTTGGVTNNTYDISADAHSNNSTWPMGIFATPNQTATSWRNGSKMKLYSLRVYEADQLVHEYLPYKNGNVLGLYDTVDKVIKTDSRASATPFKIGGMGVDGAEKWLKALPATVSVSKDTGSVTLTAAASGAIRYEWTLNGDVLAETGESVTASWRRGDFATPDIYTCTAIYDVYGAEKRGAPVSCAVTRLADAFTIIVQ